MSWLLPAAPQGNHMCAVDVRTRSNDRNVDLPIGGRVAHAVVATTVEMCVRNEVDTGWQVARK